MKIFLKTAILSACLGLLFLVEVDVDLPPEFSLQVQLVPEAQAILGVRRRAFRRGAVIGASSAAASQKAAEPPPPDPAPAPAPAPTPASASGALPLDTVVTSLPAGCTTTVVSNISYSKCGADYYRATFQGSNLVYVTVKP